MSRKLGSDRRNLTIVERVNIAEGEDEFSDSSSELDMINGDKAISFDDYINSLGDGGEGDMDDAVEISSDSHTESGDRKRKRVPLVPAGERVAFDDDEDSDAAYTSFKKRKSEKRKKDIASTKRAKAKAANGSVVGIRPKTVISLRERRRKDGEEPASDDENDLMETTLPDYLQKRRGSWEETKKKLGNAGLMIPPSYDDVYFSDDERLEYLKERPVIKNGMKRSEYKDINLPYSAGIIPAPVAQWLRDYQVEGAAFLHELFVHQKGGILGDDMGLGKTIQVIAFLTAAFGKTGDQRDATRMRKTRRANGKPWYPRILIICPGTLMENWIKELNTWGWWSIDKFHGKDKDEVLAAAKSGRLEIMITTYKTYTQNEMNEGTINEVRWDCVVADEVHQIKDKNSDNCKAMNNVNALCRIGLTGTAIQNKYEELWTLLNWTNPGRLGPLSRWKEMICVPLKLGQSHDATNYQLSKARRTAKKLVDNLLPQFFLRRMKSLIADQLPKKSDQVVFCPMTDVQIEAYNNFCDSELVQAILHSSDPCTCNSGKKQGWCCYAEVDGKKWQTFVFPAMITLQKLANHVALLIPSPESKEEKHEKEMETLKEALPDLWRKLYRERDNIMNFANTAFCGKWKVLLKLLKYWYENGDKVLVFSYSVRLLRMLHMLFKATTTYNVSYLDGSMKYEDRQHVVDDYNSDPRQFVFLISTKAGGVGLNITSANKVVVVDPNWNPSYDLQAQDRAYRIGQTRDVEVFRLVSVGTVEEIVYARQIYKQQQANIGYNASLERRYFKGVQDHKEMKGEIFGLANLFAPLSENVKLRDIVNKTNVAEIRAGVEIAGLDLEASQEEDDVNPLFDDSKEDAAMSQLAQDIIDEPAARRKKAATAAKKKDAVQAILASAGVEYSHENAEVVGTTKMETKISSRAAKAGGTMDLDQDFAFARSQENGDGGAEAGRVKRERSVYGVADSDGEEDDLDDGVEPVKYKYRPPEGVRKRQFCTMAKQFGYSDVTEFALVVEGWTQEQRRDCLERFYRDRRVRVAKM